MRHPLAGLIVIILLLGACKTPDYYFSHPIDKITTLAGPEDMVLDTLDGSERLIIACSQRRKEHGFESGVISYHIKDKSTNHVTLIGMPDSVRFDPHGIDIGTYRGRKILWVINHEDDKKRQAIIRFLIQENELHFDTILVHESIVSPNDICDGGNGKFYVSNDASTRKSALHILLKIKSGSVVFYDGKGSYQVYNKKFSYANGIIRYKDKLVVSTSRQNKVFAINCDEQGYMIENSVDLLVKGKSWDNFSRYGDLLICTSHTKPVKFLKHKNKPGKNSPFEVYSINPETKTKGIVYLSDGASISAGSTAVYYKGSLYISQVFDPFIIRVYLESY